MPPRRALITKQGARLLVEAWCRWRESNPHVTRTLEPHSSAAAITPHLQVERGTSFATRPSTPAQDFLLSELAPTHRLTRRTTTCYTSVLFSVRVVGVEPTSPRV